MVVGGALRERKWGVLRTPPTPTPLNPGRGFGCRGAWQGEGSVTVSTPSSSSHTRTIRGLDPPFLLLQFRHLSMQAWSEVLPCDSVF